jgi:cytochrome c oxidase assembly factor CtaG
MVMSTWEMLGATWNWHPSVLIGCAALVSTYLTAGRRLAVPLPPVRFTLFASGLVVLLLSLVSPLDTLGDRYLFSVHMLQHLLLVLVVPPLLLGGLPPSLVDALLTYPRIARLEHILGNPLLAWPAAMGTLWIWHLPTLYNTALLYPGIHILQHLTFLITATMFWWPVIVAPHGQWRLSVPAAILYLFSGSAANAVLGIILTFASVGLYPLYLNPAAHLDVAFFQPSQVAAIEQVIRGGWGLSAASDQQIGGLLMWIPGGLAYLLAVCGILARWYGEPEDDLPLFVVRPPAGASGSEFGLVRGAAPTEVGPGGNMR